MFCTNCGFKFEEGSAFCPNCGSKVEPLEEPVVQPSVVEEASVEATVNDAAPVPEAISAETAVPVTEPTPAPEDISVEPVASPTPAPAPAPQVTPVAAVVPMGTASVAYAPVPENSPLKNTIDTIPVAQAPAPAPIAPVNSVTPQTQAGYAPSPVVPQPQTGYAPSPVAQPVYAQAPVQPIYIQGMAPIQPMSNPAPSRPVVVAPAVSTTDGDTAILVLGIMSICLCWSGIGGLICGAIGRSKAAKFIKENGQIFGIARVGKNLSIGGLIASIVCTSFWVFYLSAVILSVVSVFAEY